MKKGIPKRSRANAISISWLALASTAGCGDVVTPQQIIRGIIIQNQLPARVVEVRALRADGDIAALDEVDLDGRFVIVVPPGPAYTIEARAANGEQITAFNRIIVHVCAVEPAVDLGAISLHAQCTPGLECEAARTELESCKISHEMVCASIAQAISECRSHRDVGCEADRAAFEACMESVCIERMCPVEEAACKEAQQRYEECTAGFGCGSLESSYIDTCLEPCSGAFTQVSRACTPPEDPEVLGQPPACDRSPAPPLDVLVGCMDEPFPSKEVPGP